MVGRLSAIRAGMEGKKIHRGGMLYGRETALLLAFMEVTASAVKWKLVRTSADKLSADTERGPYTTGNCRRVHC
jgi:hypothetical protein